MAVYIDPSRATNGTGTFADPRNTWAGITWTPGETYLQRAETEWVGTVTVGAGSVLLGTYDPATGARITGGRRRAKVNANQTQFGIVMGGAHASVTVDNFEVYNARHTTSARGIYMGTGAGANFTVTNCRVYDIRNTSSGTGAWGMGGFSDGAKYLHNEINDIGDDAIYAEGNNIEIAYNRISRVSLDGVGGDCIQLSNSVRPTNNSWTHHNWLEHDKDIKQCFITGTPGTTHPSSGGVFEDNVAIGFEGALLHKTVYVGTQNFIVRRNYISGGIRSIDADAASQGVLIHHNVISNSGTATNTHGIVLTAADGQVLNNTIVNTSGISPNVVYGIQQQNVAGTVVLNNLFMGWRYAFRTHSANPANEGSNAYWNNGANKVNESLTNLALGAGAVLTDPLLTPDWKPLPGSPLLAQGLDLGYLFRDIRGFQSRAHIGAYGAARLLRT